MSDQHGPRQWTWLGSFVENLKNNTVSIGCCNIERRLTAKVLSLGITDRPPGAICASVSGSVSIKLELLQVVG